MIFLMECNGNFCLFFYLHFTGHTVRTAIEPVWTVEHEAVVSGFKRIYWLVKHEIAHYTNYPALLELSELLGCNYFAKPKYYIMLIKARLSSSFINNHV